MFLLRRIASTKFTRFAVVGMLCPLLATCAQVQMGYNVLTYDTAVANTANQLLLLNAVRASQHYPRSFTSVGQVLAGPPIGGQIQSTMNFSALANVAGLQNYNVNPSITANAGYGQFTLGNLNAQKFMVAIRKPVPLAITKSFADNPNWPRQLLDLMYVQEFLPTEAIVRHVDMTRKSMCGNPSTTSLSRRCKQLNEQIEEYTNLCDRHFVDGELRLSQVRHDRGVYYNTAINFCHYNRFRIFSEEVRIARLRTCLKPQGGCMQVIERSALDMIGYLGELVAAQNYIEQPYTPRVLIGVSIGPEMDYFDVPLFVVRHGAPLEASSVSVEHDGILYYIPRPEFGSPQEARSMQTLELVLQTVQAATQQDDLPKTVPTVGVVASR